MKRLLTPSLGLLTLSLLLILAGCSGAGDEGTEELPQFEKTEILWDNWGVPHIYARNNNELFYAFGWAQMRSHGNLILRLYGESRGRAAEYWGESHLESDRWIRTVGIPGRAREWFEAQNSPYKEYIESFTRGVNDFAQAHPDLISDDMRPVLPVEPSDPLALAHRVIHFEFLTSPRAAQGIARQLERNPAGSNAWAIAPQHTVSGNAMLLANPHLPWSGFYSWYEAQLVSPDVNFYGAALVGQPSLSIGFNQNLGWTHTVNTIDAQDHYALQLSGRGYRWEGQTRDFDTTREVIKVKEAGGALREVPLSIHRSVHGPVIARSGNRAVSLKLAGLYQMDLIEQYWKMATASNLEEFENAVRMLQMPMFTVIYADRDGHILSLFGGLIPRRPAGNFNWRGLIPGNLERSLWTDYHTYEELPRVVDPASGWVQNANEPPWTTTLPYALNADDFPAYLAPRFMSFRAQRSARMLQEDSQIDLQEMIDYKHSTRMELADRLLDDLLPALRASNEQGAAELADLLDAWDREADADSRGAILFDAFWGEFAQSNRGSSPFAQQWEPENPMTLPDGIKDLPGAVSALLAAAEKIKQAYGDPGVAWGDVVRLRKGSVDLPANGGPGSLGIFRVIFADTDEDGKRRVMGGDSFVAAVEFSDPVRAMVVNSAGNSSSPDSPHFTDQLELFSRKEMRRALLTLQQIKTELKMHETLLEEGASAQ